MRTLQSLAMSNAIADFIPSTSGRLGSSTRCYLCPNCLAVIQYECLLCSW